MKNIIQYDKAIEQNYYGNKNMIILNNKITI